MKPLLWIFAALLPLCGSGATNFAAAPESRSRAQADQNLNEYFCAEAAKLAGSCLTDIPSLAEWQARRAEYRRQLQEMLGLWPLPERTALNPVITGKLVQEDFTVEKLQFQALPRLYVTANFYLPKKLEQPAPAILYMCGHSRMVTNGVSCGSKSWYQHHGAWFARNGYACLVIDSLELGEILGEHHGTYREGQWWWNARGYTPAGVEAWFGIRALDYLCSRAEVDKERIGMTGRSGGGSYTWTVAALDERVKVAAPIAGMTDLQNQVVDGVVQEHCDCMFFVNTYRWDFPQVAALIAPRPLLIGNSDKDTIFPLDGVVRLYTQTRHIYGLYGQTNKLGLLITDGPHADTQDLQVPVFRWFNRFLKGADPLIDLAARKYFVPAQLRAFDQLPADQINTTIQQSFVPKAQKPPADPLKTLRQEVFAGWPAEPAGLRPELAADSNPSGLRYQIYQFSSQPGIHLQLHILRDPQKPQPERLVLTVLDAPSWTNSPASGLLLGNCGPEALADLRQEMQAGKVALAFVAPRGVEPAPWLNNPTQFTQIRRRFMLLGQTLDSMRVWDIRCAAQVLKSLPEFKQVPLSVRAKGPMGINAAYAALFEPGLERLELAGLPASHEEGPDYLNVLKVWDIPQLLERLGGRVEIKN